MSAIEQLDSARLASIQDSAYRIARRAHEFRDHFTSRWHVLGELVPSPRLADILRDDLAAIATRVAGLMKAAEHGANYSGVSAPDTLGGAEQLLVLLTHLRDAPPAVPAKWLDAGGLDRAEQGSRALRHLMDERQRLRAELSEQLGGPPPGDIAAETGSKSPSQVEAQASVGRF